MPDEKGVTRREKNDAFGYEAPQPEIPAAGALIWETYHELSARLRRVIDRQAIPISPSDLNAWFELTGLRLHRKEIKIFFQMDEVFCNEVNLELQLLAQREKEELEQKSKSGKSRRR